MTEQNSRTFPGLSRTLKLKIPGPRTLWLTFKTFIEDSAIAEASYVLASRMVIFLDVPDSITPQLLKPR